MKRGFLILSSVGSLMLATVLAPTAGAGTAGAEGGFATVIPTVETIFAGEERADVEAALARRGWKLVAATGVWHKAGAGIATDFDGKGRLINLTREYRVAVRQISAEALCHGIDPEQRDDGFACAKVEASADSGDAGAWMIRVTKSGQDHWLVVENLQLQTGVLTLRSDLE